MISLSNGPVFGVMVLFETAHKLRTVFECLAQANNIHFFHIMYE